MERRFMNKTSTSSSSAHSDVAKVSGFAATSNLGSSDKSSLVSRLNTKLNAVNQKMSIVLDNAEDLNLKKSQVRALTREVLLEEKLKRQEKPKRPDN